MARRHDQLVKMIRRTEKQISEFQEENGHILDIIVELKPSLLDNISETSSNDDSESLSDPEEIAAARIEKKLSKIKPKRKLKPGSDDEEGRDSKKGRKTGKRDARTDAKPVKLLPRDETGQLLLPVTIGRGNSEVTITSIGHVLPKENYHTPRYIWTVGFSSYKSYFSMSNPSGRTNYINKILDGGDDGPVFVVEVEDIPGLSYQGHSASGVWKKVIDDIALKSASGSTKTHASGPDFFGLSDLGVTKVIQELIGADKCRRYVMQKWEEEKEES